MIRLFLPDIGVQKQNAYHHRLYMVTQTTGMSTIDSKFSDRWANSAGPDQPAPRLFKIIPAAPFGQISLWKDLFV